MKTYFLLLLLAFITCVVDEKQTDEIVLKSFGRELIEKIADIWVNCGDDDECYSGQIIELSKNMTPKQVKEFENYRKSPECMNDCNEIFSKITDEYEFMCPALCIEI